ncbi:6891_t:CDS:10 [Diversispora eburnea]|uniref:6891_t:CDS:1 n=1 Tax=Diversispora eburnea TaxID=1213867 RepID=A0A9N8YNI2_9GLOM|nr:6891_t:CDS:10 [Diversispora eburnea]
MAVQTYDVAANLFSIVLDVFFREIRSRGSHRIPKEGPIIFVAAPHANQFVDPLILMRHCQRRVSFLIAEKSTRRRFIGTIAKYLDANLAKPGIGRIQLLNCKTEPTRIFGINTKFTQQLQIGYQIGLPRDRGTSEVIKIISDTELLIKKEFRDIKALEMLTNPEGTSFVCIPQIDQSSVYQVVFERLNNGHCIGIFPEGGSHDRPEILPLKAGVTIMALGAVAANPQLDVKIVPCGLNYFQAHSFRSKAVIEFGSPISISPELVEKYKEGGSSKREASGRRLYRPAHRKLPISQIVELNRRFIAGYEYFKDDSRVQEMRKQVIAYNKLLNYYGLKDHQVNRTAIGGPRAAGLLLYRVMLLTTWSSLGLPGFILNLPLVIIARKVSARKAEEAVRSSSVKVAGRDVLATWKLLVALVVTPLLYGFYTFIVVLISFRKRWILKWKLFAPISTFCTLVTGSYVTIRFVESGLDIYKSIRPLFLSLLPWTRPNIENLRNVREKLSDDLTNLINQLAPQIYPDFDVERIISQSTATTNSITSTAMSIFQSPIDWLDDKIFSWDRPDNNNYISEYDDVLFFLEKNNGSTMSGRSRTSSWGSVSSSRSRSRANSFGSVGCGNVTEGLLRVEALTELPKDQPFAEVTKVTKRISSVITKIKDKENDYDSGYQGDKEDDGNQKTFREDSIYICPWEGCKKNQSNFIKLEEHLHKHTQQRPFKVGSKDYFTCYFAFQAQGVVDSTGTDDDTLYDENEKLNLGKVKNEIDVLVKEKVSKDEAAILKGKDNRNEILPIHLAKLSYRNVLIKDMVNKNKDTKDFMTRRYQHEEAVWDLFCKGIDAISLLPEDPIDPDYESDEDDLPDGSKEELTEAEQDKLI